MRACASSPSVITTSDFMKAPRAGREGPLDLFDRAHVGRVDLSGRGACSSPRLGLFPATASSTLAA